VISRTDINYEPNYGTGTVQPSEANVYSTAEEVRFRNRRIIYPDSTILSVVSGGICHVHELIEETETVQNTSVVNSLIKSKVDR
jgi:hypothetical protein